MKKKKMGKGLDALLDLNGGFADDADVTESKKAVNENSDTADTAGASGVRFLRVSEVEPDRSQPRTSFDEDAISELAQSVSQHGVLQPILVRPIKDGYKIVAGERRWRAAMQAHLKEIPAIIRDMTELEAAQIALIENLQRESLNPVEEAFGYKRLIDEFSMTQEQIAKQMSKPRSVIANSLRLLNLPESVRKMLADGDISVGHAKVLAGADPDTAVLLAEKTVAEKLTVRELEKLLSEGFPPDESTKLVNKVLKAKQTADPFITELELAMGKAMSRKVKVKQQKGGKLQLDIEFKNIDELKKFASRLAGQTDSE